jgi:hypothetical protein
VLVPEALHEHRLAHAAVAIDRDRRHSSSSRNVEKPAQSVEGLLGARVEHPSARSNGANATLVIFAKQLDGARRQMGDLIAHVSSLRILDKWYALARIDAAKRAPPVIRLWILSASASRGCRLSFRFVHQFALRDRGANDGARVDFAASLGQQRATGGQGLVEGDGGQGDVGVACFDVVPDGRLTKTRAMSLGSYLTSSRWLDRPTSALRAGDQ